MFKKYLALFVFSIANLLIIGHDIMPHKHSTEVSHHQHHHHTDGDAHRHEHQQYQANNSDEQNDSDDKNEESSGLEVLFSNFTHVGFYLQQEELGVNTVSIDKSSNNTNKLFVCIGNVGGYRFVDKQQILSWFDPPNFPSTQLLSSGLRAPPFFYS